MGDNILNAEIGRINPVRTRNDLGYKAKHEYKLKVG